MENTIMKIVFRRKLTNEEFEKIGKWLADNVPEVRYMARHIEEITEEDLPRQRERR